MQLTVIKDYMTKKDMQDYFDISESTLDNWRKHGLHEVKVFSKVYFSKKWCT